jgi:hypothetical protein
MFDILLVIHTSATTPADDFEFWEVLDNECEVAAELILVNAWGGQK